MFFFLTQLQGQPESAVGEESVHDDEETEEEQYSAAAVSESLDGKPAAVVLEAAAGLGASTDQSSESSAASTDPSSESLDGKP